MIRHRDYPSRQSASKRSAEIFALRAAKKFANLAEKMRVSGSEDE
jgi:hypothetical protein